LSNTMLNFEIICIHRFMPGYSYGSCSDGFASATLKIVN